MPQFIVHVAIDHTTTERQSYQVPFHASTLAEAEQLARSMDLASLAPFATGEQTFEDDTTFVDAIEVTE